MRLQRETVPAEVTLEGIAQLDVLLDPEDVPLACRRRRRLRAPSSRSLLPLAHRRCRGRRPRHPLVVLSGTGRRAWQTRSPASGIATRSQHRLRRASQPLGDQAADENRRAPESTGPLSRPSATFGLGLWVRGSDSRQCLDEESRTRQAEAHVPGQVGVPEAGGLQTLLGARTHERSHDDDRLVPRRTQCRSERVARVRSS